jgi:hypothetical protein
VSLEIRSSHGELLVVESRRGNPIYLDGRELLKKSKMWETWNWIAKEVLKKIFGT